MQTTTDSPKTMPATSVGSGGWLGWFSIATFLIYTIIWDVGLIAGACYLIWWKDASAWLLLPAMILVTQSYKPKTWRELWERKA